MKLLLYDIRELELNYLLDKIPGNIEPYYIKSPLIESTYIDEQHLNAEAISVFVSSILDRKILEKFKNLKFIFLRCVGFSNVDLDYCKKRGILVFNTPNYGNSTVAEFVFCLILTLSRKIALAKKTVIEGTIDQDELIGTELEGKTIGIIGGGAIGKKVIEIAKGFNLNVLVYDINKNSLYNYVELDELLKQSDFVSINCPLNESTKHLINDQRLALMKKEAVLINTARGEIVDTRALYNALVNKKISAAALDVVECEETLCQTYGKCEKYDALRTNCLKKFFFIQKLIQLPQVIVTPHIAYNTKEAQERILDITLFNINESLNITSGFKNLVLI